MATFKVGQTVTLKAHKKHHLPEESAKILKIESGEFLVRTKSEEFWVTPNSIKTEEVKSINKTNKKVMAKTAKKTEKKAAAKKVAKKSTTNRAAIEGGLTRKEAAELLKTSIYAVDQHLINKRLKSLSKDDVMKFKKAAKA